MKNNDVSLRKECTFLMLKPDGVKRGLLGEIIGRIEKSGLKVIGIKMVNASRDKVDQFYPSNDSWISRLGEKTLNTYSMNNIDPIVEIGTDDPFKIGQRVREWLLDYMVSGPLVPIVIEGHHAVIKVRRLLGDTMPVDAPIGTIRGDYSSDSATIANTQHRAVMNIIHGTESVAEAKKEIEMWFSENELCTYIRVGETLE